jgi:hypothetical protein
MSFCQGSVREFAASTAGLMVSLRLTGLGITGIGLRLPRT